MKRSDFLLTFAGFALSIFAAPNLLAEDKKMTRKEFEEFLKAQVKTAENGDVYIELKPPKEDIKKRARFVKKEEEFFDRKITMEKLRPALVPNIFLEWLCIYEPILDFEKYYKLLEEEEKELEKEKQKKSRNAGKRYVPPKPKKEKPDRFRPLPPIVVDFLKENGLKPRIIGYSKNALVEKIKAGNPVGVSGGFRGDLKERSEKRKTFENILQWRDTVNAMRKTETSVTSYGFRLITGFNEQSQEYRICGGAGEIYWITEAELRESCDRIVEIKF